MSDISESSSRRNALSILGAGAVGLAASTFSTPTPAQARTSLSSLEQRIAALEDETAALLAAADVNTLHHVYEGSSLPSGLPLLDSFGEPVPVGFVGMFFVTNETRMSQQFTDIWLVSRTSQTFVPVTRIHQINNNPLSFFVSGGQVLVRHPESNARLLTRMVQLAPVV